MTDFRLRTEPLVKISIVAPAFNEEENILRFAEAIDEVLRRAHLEYEIVFVNDGSSDGTLPLMRRLRSENDRITIVNLSRNFGKEIAMTAGIAHARGTVIVIIDTDLQDPPELIPQLVESWREGYDVVYAQRRAREGETWLKKATASWFYKLMQFTGPVTIPRDTGDFRLISQRVAKALLELPEHHRFMKGLYSWVGFPQKSLLYDRHARHTGSSKWNYWKLWNLAIEGITSFTIAPLKLASYAGFFSALIASIYALYIIGRTLIFGDSVAGFPTLLTVIVFLGGVQLLVLGIIGEYLGRIFNETKRRPLFLVESVEWSANTVDRQS
jgi:polyisoprenyl-phosphate glycosyltransferase